MKKIFPLILLTFFSLNLLASTDISEGSVSGIWTFDESPYYVLGNINIEAGEILTIEPGVDIIFSDSTTMESEGTIIAQGTIDNIITFKSNETWKGIDIGSLQPDTPPSVFEYCHFTDILYQGISIQPQINQLYINQ